ncbi:iron complex transport system substrate-binding protein [Nocardioides daedukensis]|uniref:Iron complex transport system substrate-binding protein n=1 Tax=Nocardioides daedukensis TaxID=634462 RepID=A0A7Y9UPG8_9ACTN|nr:ABC transporter substrate-binding protein [Nocardioides daedukensis]NYG58242.1 iron complex transport system substrate-binding protein [Nocardioides daedukensis]
MSQPLRTVVALTSLCLALSGCGLVKDDDSASVKGDGYYPVTVENCGASVTIRSEPERLVLLKNSDVPILDALGVLDRTVAKAGAFPSGYYDDVTAAALEEVPSLTSKSDASGHLQISKEVVIGAEPDLVFGEVENLSRETLREVRIDLLENPGLCGEGLTDPGFDDVHAQIALLGKVFNREAEATRAVARMEAEVSALEGRAANMPARTAAVLYPTIAGGTTYAYGARSMAHPQLEAAGFENVFASQRERVFEVSMETLLAKNPDVLILLHPNGDPKKVEQAVTDLPGANTLTAVRNGDVMTQLFNYTEPPSPLAVAGLEKIIERFGEDR